MVILECTPFHSMTPLEDQPPTDQQAVAESPPVTNPTPGTEPAATAAPPQGAKRKFLGQLVSTLLHPNLLQAVVFMCIYRPLTPYTAAVLLLGLGVVPVLMMGWALRNHLPDRFSYVLVRQVRYIPIGINLVAVGVTFSLLYATAPPQEPSTDLRMVISTHVGLHVVALLITYGLKFKVSLHMLAVTAAGCMVVLLAPEAWRPLMLGALLLLIAGLAWSRLRLKAHTPAEVVAGIFTGLLVPGVVWWVVG